MAAQHAKWLKVCNGLPWRQPIASLNLILASNVWQQDHNGFTHQDPGFLDHIANKRRMLSVCTCRPMQTACSAASITASRAATMSTSSWRPSIPRPQWLTMEQAVQHCTRASASGSGRPTIRAQNRTLSWRAAARRRRSKRWLPYPSCGKSCPNSKVRVVNVVDLMKLQPEREHPHGLSDAEYDMLFTKDKPIIFAFHGYPTLVHELTYRRHNRNLHVRGYRGGGHHHHAVRYARAE